VRVLVFSILFIGLAIGMAAPAQTGNAVPASLLAAAGADPTSFVHLLAEAGVPAGLEIRKTDFQRRFGLSKPWDPADWTQEKLARQAKVPIERVVSAFNERHAEYRATLIDMVVVIRPVPQRVTYLDGPAPFGRLRVVGLMTIAERVFASLDPTLDGPGGRPGSSLGQADRGWNLELSVTGVGLNILEALNEIVRQAPGHQWLVVTTDGDRPRIERFGFLHRNGATSEHPIPGA
jgi:hypothetical protein